MIMDIHTNTLFQPSHPELIELTDDELDTLAGGAHHHRHHHRHHHGHGGAIAHSGSDFFKRSLTINTQTTTGAHGTTTTVSIELTEIMSHSGQTQIG